MARTLPARRMRGALGCLATGLLWTSGAGADPTVVGTATRHEVSWQSEVGFNYQVEVSPDLRAWSDTSVVEPGTGALLRCELSSAEEQLFYRIRETVAAFDDSFLVRPIEGQQVDLIDGVVFSFDLDALPELPPGE